MSDAFEFFSGEDHKSADTASEALTASAGSQDDAGYSAVVELVEAADLRVEPAMFRALPGMVQQLVRGGPDSIAAMNGLLDGLGLGAVESAAPASLALDQMAATLAAAHAETGGSRAAFDFGRDLGQNIGSAGVDFGLMDAFGGAHTDLENTLSLFEGVDLSGDRAPSAPGLFQVARGSLDAAIDGQSLDASGFDGTMGGLAGLGPLAAAAPFIAEKAVVVAVSVTAIVIAAAINRSCAEKPKHIEINVDNSQEINITINANSSGSEAGGASDSSEEGVSLTEEQSQELFGDNDMEAPDGQGYQEISAAEARAIVSQVAQTLAGCFGDNDGAERNPAEAAVLAAQFEQALWEAVSFPAPDQDDNGGGFGADGPGYGEVGPNPLLGHRTDPDFEILGVDDPLAGWLAPSDPMDPHGGGSLPSGDDDGEIGGILAGASDGETGLIG